MAPALSAPCIWPISAEVIKIENRATAANGARRRPAFFRPEDSQFFHSFNVNKSLTLDLTQDAGRAIFTYW